LNTQVLGISVDHIDCLKAWAESLGGITYPLLSDFWPHGEVADCYGVLRQKDGYTERAIFIIDKRGIIRYIDIHDIDTQPDNELLFDTLWSIDPTSLEGVQGADRPRKTQAPAVLPHGGIVMYCTNWCPDCKRARKWLAEQGLAYTEVNITTTPGADNQLREWANGNLTTPTFEIDGTILVDFNAEKLDAVLKEKGLH
jgi:glutaredoxin